MRLAKLILLGFGLYILYYTIQDVGLKNILDSVHHLGWAFAPILLVYPFIFAFGTFGWRYAFPRGLSKSIPWHNLYTIRIIGETLNAIIPFSASLGGEPVKAELLKSRYGLPLSEGLASLLIVHTTFWVSLNIFVIGGILVTLKSMPLTPVLWKCILAFLAGLGGLALLLIIGLHYGIFRNTYSIGEFFKWWKPGSDEKKVRFLALDQDIKKFYTQNKKSFFLSVFWNFLAWLTGAIEVYFVGKLVGIDINFSQAWLLEALIQVLRIVTFFIPSSVGVQEGGIVLIFSELGFAAGPSLALALVRRIREIIWIGAGLALWGLMKEKSPVSIK